MIDHVSIQVRNLPASAAFYDAVLAPLGGKRLLEFPDVIGYGTLRPEFWVGRTKTAGDARETHLAFLAADAATVKAFHEAAVAAGATVLHTPRLWPEYHASYFAAYVRDPDGNNVEAVCHTGA
jgi:catechol 2,3-dioxygenase-like lactoylglutathione lyase family enzyme